MSELREAHGIGSARAQTTCPMEKALVLDVLSETRVIEVRICLVARFWHGEIILSCRVRGEIKS